MEESVGACVRAAGVCEGGLTFWTEAREYYRVIGRLAEAQANRCGLKSTCTRKGREERKVPGSAPGRDQLLVLVPYPAQGSQPRCRKPYITFSRPGLVQAGATKAVNFLRSSADIGRLQRELQRNNCEQLPAESTAGSLLCCGQRGEGRISELGHP